MTRPTITFYLPILVVTLVLDQVVKYWIRGNLVIGQSLHKPFPGFFEITHTENHGIAFGMFQGNGVMFAPVAAIIVIAVSIWSWRKPQESLWFHLSLALLASGAIGNLYDRVRYGKVTDMFWFRAIDFPVFNIADACITVAAFLLILQSWKSEAKAHATKSSAQPAPSENS